MTLHSVSYMIYQAGFTDLNWSIPVVGDLDFDPLTTGIDRDALVLDDNSPRKGVLSVRSRYVCRE